MNVGKKIALLIKFLFLLVQFIDNFVLEKNTWRMIGRLYHDRLTTNLTSADEMDTGADVDADSVVFKMSEKKMVERLFKRESFLRQAQAVVDWLEQVKWRFDDVIGWETLVL